MSFDACLQALRQGDPDRFAIVLAAPAGLRPALAGLYALNLEIARAPLASAEPLLAQMRLQWWDDALAAHARGAAMPGHEVLNLIAAEWGQEIAGMRRVIAARARDAARDPIPDEAILMAYLRDTGGAVMQIAARRAGLDDDPALRDHAEGAALAGWLRALPELAQLGLGLAPDAADPHELAARGASLLAQARPKVRALPRHMRIVLFPGAGAGPALRAMAARRDWAQSPISQRFERIRLAFRGDWRG